MGMIEFLCFLFFIPFHFFGSGWMWVIIGFINLRDKILGHDPHGGSEGSLIEYGIIQGIAGGLTCIPMILCFQYSFVTGFIFLLIWIVWCLVNLLWFYILSCK